MPRTGRAKTGVTGRSGWPLAAVLAVLLAAGAVAADLRAGPPAHVRPALAAQDGGGERSRISPPEMPPGADLDANIAMAQSVLDPWTLMRLVRAEGEWDYRCKGFGRAKNPYVSAGNFNYGATASAVGIPRWLIQRAAAVAQVFGG